MAKIQPAQTTLTFIDSVENLNNKYIDIAQCLSFVNRRQYEQGKCYYVESIKIGLNQAIADTGIIGTALATIPDTWVTANAWVKAKALWDQMNQKVLEDNPSVQGKWAQFITFMDVAHQNGGSGTAGPNLNLLPKDTGNNSINTGEWAVSEYVFPQHSVNTTTGDPEPADEATCHMLGDDDGDVTAGTLASGGIIASYQDTRARVQIAPDVPADMSISWMTLLTDDGSQEPELADIIEAANDEPPYDRDDYVGGAANWSLPVNMATSIIGLYSPEDTLMGFKVPLGLIKVFCNESVSTNNPSMLIELKLAKGHYKGVAATAVRQ